MNVRSWRVVAIVVSLGLVAGCGTPRTTPVVDVDPVAPVPLALEAEGWEDAAITSVCLEVSAEGDLEPGYQGGGPREFVNGLFEAVGVTVVEDGCDATLTIDLTARLIGASYGPTCYEGHHAEATAWFDAPGLPRVEASRLISKEPPAVIPETACTRESQVPLKMWQGMLESDSEDDPGVLLQLMGDRLLLAQELSLFTNEAGSSSFSRDASGDSLDQWVIDTLAAALYQDDRALRVFGGSRRQRDRRPSMGAE